MPRRPTTLSPGDRFGPYEILSPVGAGGMGEVYRARDTRLRRFVAIKVLPEALLQDPERRRRLQVEARAVSSLNHPNICTLHDVGRQDTEHGPIDYLVMEYLEGETLAERIASGPLPIEECLRHAIQIAGGLDAAHRRGLVHRDLKPGNVMLTPTGAKLLDFGLARRTVIPSTGDQQSAAPTVTAQPATRAGFLMGTPAYMSPEQALGRPADARSDVFAFGLLLHEMVSGAPAFSGESELQVIADILRGEPQPARSHRPEVSGDLQSIIDRCLNKAPEKRYQDARSLQEDLAACERRLTSPGARAPWRAWILVTAGVVVVAALAFSIWIGWRSAREREARREILPEMRRLVESDRAFAAFRLAREHAGEFAGDPEFDRLLRDISIPASLNTEPEGAEVLYKDYNTPKAEWERLGVTPVQDVPMPVSQIRLKIVKDGFEPVELVLSGPTVPAVVMLTPLGQTPPGMVRVRGGQVGYRATREVVIDDYWLDRHEVTNRAFKEFVDQGGYRNPSLWPDTFVGRGRTLTFEEAMALFRDTTGRPGPATWELGTYPEGQEDYPVGGVSWYEAQAYATFVGKSLPTFLHWYRAAGAETLFSGIIRLSNFGGEGPAPVGSHQGLSPWGNLDMAGNVREWVWNAAGDRRYTLGGAWNDPTYLFTGPDALDPLDRDPMLGFRCALYPKPPPDEALEPIKTVFRDYSKETPVADAIFSAYRRLHRYDSGPLEARVESPPDDLEYWREEQVSYAAAYDDERIPATLFLPKNAAPPYQAVVFFPPGSANLLGSIHDAGTRQFSFLIRSGRALLFPVYEGTYERRLRAGAGGADRSRDLRIRWSKDVGRSLDYLEERPDIDSSRIAFYGLSMGAAYGPIAGAVEPRFRTLVFVSGGLSSGPLAPEVDSFNFAPRVHVPVLMINGNHDFIFPLEESQKPLFRLLGVPESDKRHYMFDGGHVPPHWQVIARETLDWLDRRMGPVRTTAAP